MIRASCLITGSLQLHLSVGFSVRGKAIGTVRWSHGSNAVSSDLALVKALLEDLHAMYTTKATHDSPAAWSSKPIQKSGSEDKQTVTDIAAETATAIASPEEEIGRLQLLLISQQAATTAAVAAA
jgi:hypothetical protein